MHSSRFVAIALLAACGAVEPEAPDAMPEADAAPAANLAGRHDHTLDVDGASREVIVYVPDAAAGTASVSAVLMFHGTSGDGEKFYNISGWKEKADAEGLIAVFPSALTHCFWEDENRDGDFEDAGERKVTTKWASGALGTDELPLCTADELAQLPDGDRARADHPVADDVAFADAILELLATDYVVDAQRVYASGFSNGAGMTSRLALERSDRFAAIAAAAGALKLDPAPAERPLSLVWSLGTLDDGFAAQLGVTEIPITPTLFTDYPQLAGIRDEYLTVLQLEDTHTYEEEAVGGKRIGRFTFASSAAGADNVFTFALVEDLGHQYPNGSNHPLAIVDQLWTFFSSESLP